MRLSTRSRFDGVDRPGDVDLYHLVCGDHPLDLKAPFVLDAWVVIGLHLGGWVDD